MTENWKLVLHEKAEQELEKLTYDLQVDFVYIGDLLIEHHPAKVGMPHVKYIKEKLWEMRLSGINNIARAIYTIDKKVIIVLHLFIKKTQKTPNQAIKIAQKRMKEVKL